MAFSKEVHDRALRIAEEARQAGKCLDYAEALTQAAAQAKPAPRPAEPQRMARAAGGDKARHDKALKYAEDCRRAGKPLKDYGEALAYVDAQQPAAKLSSGTTGTRTRFYSSFEHPLDRMTRELAELHEENQKFLDSFFPAYERR